MKEVNKYLKKRKNELEILLRLPQQKYSPSVFHKLRITLKKLNAIFILTNSCAQHFKYKKTFKPFQQIFSQAGKVRELQIEEVMMKKYFPTLTSTNYQRTLKETDLDKQSSFFTTIHQISLPDLDQKYHKLQSYLPKINKKNGKKYLLKQQKKIHALLRTPVLQTDQVHELRKGLKVYNYSRKCLGMEDRFEAFPKQDELTALLGKWHDGRVIISHIRKAMESYAFIPKELKKLQKIKEKIYAQNEILLSKINDLHC